MLLEVVLSKITAWILVSIAWVYSGVVGILVIFLKPSTSETNSNCIYNSDMFHRGPKTLWAASNITVVLIITLIQIKSVYKLRRRLCVSIASARFNGSVQFNDIGHGNTRPGLNILYKRALMTSGLVALGYTVGWLPATIGLVLHDWSSLDQAKVGQVSQALFTLSVLQGFCNAIIFRFRHQDYKCFHYIQNRLCIH